MLAHLHRFPPLFATTNEKSSIMAKMDDVEAERLVMYVTIASGECYMAEFDENQLSQIKDMLGESVSWSHFFDYIRNSFNDGNIALGSYSESPDNASSIKNKGEQLWVSCLDSTESGGKATVRFLVSETDVDVMTIIVNNLTEFQQVNLRFKEKEQALEAIEEELLHSKSRVENLKKEATVLAENKIRKQEQDTRNKQRTKELMAKLTLLQSEYALKGKKVMETNSKCGVTASKSTAQNSGDESPPSPKGRIRQPLGEKECKDYDVELLRLVKSRWCNENGSDRNSTFKHVIIPYSQSELSQRLKNISTTHKIIWDALGKLDAWDYSVFDIQRAMGGDDCASLNDQRRCGSLFITTYALFVKYEFMQKFEIDEQIALNWISNVEAGYNGNLYHNAMHAADVVHGMHYILLNGGLTRRCSLTDKQVFAAIFAAAIHDYNHPGINNNFHVKTRSYYAILYNDRSVLENMHVSSVFELMKNPRLNVLSSFSEEHRREIRETVIEMVLATDMGLHGKFVTQFKRRLGEGASFTERDDQHLALAMGLKMADISNCGKPLKIYLKWSGKISDEFFMQGDRERNLGIPCSPFMDRTEPALTKGQIAFINYIILPFFEMMAELLPDMRLAVQHAEACKAYWMGSGKGETVS